MKKVVAGLGFLFAGILLGMTSGIVVGINIQYTTSWDTSLGRYWQTMLDCGLMPFAVLGYVLLTCGILLTLWGVLGKSKY